MALIVLATGAFVVVAMTGSRPAAVMLLSSFVAFLIIESPGAGYATWPTAVGPIVLPDDRGVRNRAKAFPSDTVSLCRARPGS